MYDRNRDGTVYLAQIMGVMRTLGVQPNEAELTEAASQTVH